MLPVDFEDHVFDGSEIQTDRQPIEFSPIAKGICPSHRAIVRIGVDLFPAHRCREGGSVREVAGGQSLQEFRHEVIVPLDVVTEHARGADSIAGHTGGIVVADSGPCRFTDQFEGASLQGPIYCEDVDIS